MDTIVDTTRFGLQKLSREPTRFNEIHHTSVHHSFMRTMETDMTKPYLLTISEAFALMSCSRSAFFDLRQRDPEFPKEIRLTPRAVRYRNTDIIDYIERRAEKPFTG